MGNESLVPESTTPSSFGKADSSASAAATTEHFWVCAYPFFETTMFFVPPQPSVIRAPDAGAGESIKSNLVFFDPDGAEINQIEFQYPANSVGVAELDVFLGACKLQAGLKHAQVMVTSPKGSGHFCRVHSREGGALLGEPALVSEQQAAFFPVIFGEGRSHVLCLINHLAIETQLKCRLFCGKRTPETVLSVPGRGARVINVEAEFSEQASVSGDKQAQAYIRLIAKSEGRFGAQLLERTDGKQEGGLFQGVS